MDCAGCLQKLFFGRSGGLFVAIFLPKEEAKRISTTIPNAKPTKLTYHVPFQIINDELKSKLNRFFTVNEMDDPEG